MDNDEEVGKQQSNKENGRRLHTRTDEQQHDYGQWWGWQMMDNNEDEKWEQWTTMRRWVTIKNTQQSNRKNGGRLRTRMDDETRRMTDDEEDDGHKNNGWQQGWQGQQQQKGQWMKTRSTTDYNVMRNNHIGRMVDDYRQGWMTRQGGWQTTRRMTDTRTTDFVNNHLIVRIMPTKVASMIGWASLEMMLLSIVIFY